MPSTRRSVYGSYQLGKTIGGRPGRSQAIGHNILLGAAIAGGVGIASEVKKQLSTRKEARNAGRNINLKQPERPSARSLDKHGQRSNKGGATRGQARAAQVRAQNRARQSGTGNHKGGKKGRRGGPTRGAGGKFTGWSS